jgi:hypothetical protein
VKKCVFWENVPVDRDDDYADSGTSASSIPSLLCHCPPFLIGEPFPAFLELDPLMDSAVHPVQSSTTGDLVGWIRAIRSSTEQ